MLSEQEVTDLLHTNERHRSMQPTEQDRLRARLGIEAPPAPVSQTNANTRTVIAGAVSPTDISTPRTQQRTGWRERPIAWAAAAVFLLVAGFALIVQGTADDDSVNTVAVEPENGRTAATLPQPVIPTPAPTTTATGAAFCRGEFVDLVEGMQAWQGIDEWARLTDDRAPEPDLRTLTVAALDGLALLVDHVDISTQRDTLNSSLDEAAGTSNTGRRQRVAALFTAVTFIDETITSNLSSGSTHFLDCNQAELRQAAAPLD